MPVESVWLEVQVPLPPHVMGTWTLPATSYKGALLGGGRLSASARVHWHARAAQDAAPHHAEPGPSTETWDMHWAGISSARPLLSQRVTYPGVLGHVRCTMVNSFRSSSQINLTLRSAHG